MQGKTKSLSWILVHAVLSELANQFSTCMYRQCPIKDGFIASVTVPSLQSPSESVSSAPCEKIKRPLSPFHTNWRRLAMHWRPTILDTSPMHRQTSPDNVSTLPSHRQRSSAVVNASSSLAIFLECSKKSPSLANGRQWIKRRQSVVSATPTIAKLRQQLANASLTDRQCFWTSKGESQ